MATVPSTTMSTNTSIGATITAGSACARGVPIPLQALVRRLEARTELPSWAVYLPEPVLRSMPGVELAEPQRPSQSLPVSQQVSASYGAEPPRPSQSLPVSQEAKSPPPRRFAPQWRHKSASSGGNDGQRSKVSGVAKSSAGVDASNVVCDSTLPSNQIWSLARDVKGCRQVQAALDAASTEQEREAIARGLRGHVWDAMRCPNANFVLQKCVSLLSPQASRFVLSEVIVKGRSAMSQAARNKYGCRIIQRLLEHCPATEVKPLAEVLIMDAVTISRHPYGNYVMQHLLEYGTREQQSQLMEQLRKHAASVGNDEYASAVLGKALSVEDGGEEGSQERRALARAVAQVPGMVALMAKTRHGHLAARLVLQLLGGEDLDSLRRELALEEPSLRTSRYGRTVVALISPSYSHRQPYLALTPPTSLAHAARFRA